ncbi:Uma2 family endonuclease [Streptomyces olivaceiscleroticus]|uniref:Uma2 family endonuclease n=1 Tax=Streptomyces olivaceiscleroticus TaxID=68245 RepID=A0ABN1ANI3_9ACTN
MTAIAEQPQMLRQQMPLELFEELARVAMLHDDGPRLEFIDGRLGVKAMANGDHGRFIQWLTRLCMQARPELWVHPEQGLCVGTYRGGRARPDGMLAPSDAFVGAGEWADPDSVLMTVEVTSYDSDADRRDRIDKPRAYAETGIPVYLLIDRDSCELKVFSQPDGSRYERVQITPFGKEAHLPDPIDLTLDTEPLKNWVS